MGLLVRVLVAGFIVAGCVSPLRSHGAVYSFVARPQALSPALVPQPVGLAQIQLELTQKWAVLRTTVVDASAFGARGDGRVATDCRMAAGAATLNCSSERFHPADAGKPIAVYGAGRSISGFVQPLSAAIVGVVSGTTVTLSAPALSEVNGSPRVVWGTDNTSAFERAIDALANATDGKPDRGGVLRVPAGTYLVRTIALPCALKGTFERGRCRRAHNNLWIRGAGRDATALENWDVETPHQAVISLGEQSEIPERRAGVRPSRRLSRIAITDLTVRQVSHTSVTRNVITGYATEDVWIVNTAGIGPSYECYVMGSGVKSLRWQVHYNVMGPCGLGGPSFGGSTSALNLNGTDWFASGNLVRESGHGVEMGSVRGALTDNVLLGFPGSAFGVHVGSSVSGAWDNVIARNEISNFSVGVAIANTAGTVNRTQVVDNVFINNGVLVSSGRERNSVAEGPIDSVVHGTSVVRGNTFKYDGAVNAPPIRVGEGPGGPQTGLESAVIADNRVAYASMFIDVGPDAGTPCSVDPAPPRRGTCRLQAGLLELTGPFGGGRPWRPGTPHDVDDHAVPTLSNGYHYIAVSAGISGQQEPAFPERIGGEVLDGTVTWRNAGARPKVVARDNVIQGPPGAVTSTRDVVLFEGTERRLLEISGLMTNFAWTIFAQGPKGSVEVVPAGASYDDRSRDSAPGVK